MEIAHYMRALGTFVPMEVHIGKLLRELYLATGVKMERFASALNHSPKTIYYHFGQEHLNTAILEAYEVGLKSLGREVDIWDMISRKRKGYDVLPADDPWVASDPAAQYKRLPPPSVADLLRQAADQLEKERSAPAPDRDKPQR